MGVLRDFNNEWGPSLVIPEENFHHELMLQTRMQAHSLASAPMMQFHAGSLSPMPPQERPKCSDCGREDREHHDDFCPRDKRSVIEILQGWINKWLSDAIIT